VAEDTLDRLVERLQAGCLARGLTVVTAESCTGGLIAKLITDVPGSSGYFKGGAVPYADAAKTALLGVSTELLTAHGAVSAQVARAMALGAVERLGADVAVAVTGVSGPGGGNAAKPVGLTYVAAADGNGVEIRRYVWSGDRAANREATARAALLLLLERVELVIRPSDAAPEPSDAALADAPDRGPELAPDARP
jgi:PncC family amidohydrolase